MTFRLIASGLLSLAFLSAASPKGDFVLLDQGVAANQNFAVLGTLTLDGAGNVAGVEVFRSLNLSMTADLIGTYVMSSVNSGTLTLNAVNQDTTDGTTIVQNYRFLVDGNGEMQAIRTDSAVFSTSSIVPSQAAPAKGTMALNELDRNSAQLAQLALDGNGAVAGTAVWFGVAGSVNGTLTGSYTAPAKGLGTLTLNVAAVDASGTDQSSVQTYRTASTRNGIKAIRLDPGVVAIANLELQ